MNDKIDTETESTRLDQLKEELQHLRQEGAVKLTKHENDKPAYVVRDPEGQYLHAGYVSGHGGWNLFRSEELSSASLTWLAVSEMEPVDVEDTPILDPMTIKRF